MGLLEQLQKANIDALKNHDKAARAVLSVTINKVTVREKEHAQTVSDEEVLAIILKVKKELVDEKTGYEKVGNAERVKNIEAQSLVLEKFIPKQLSSAEIVSEINKLSDKSLPNIMKHFKINFAGRVDMSLVSQLAKTI